MERKTAVDLTKERNMTMLMRAWNRFKPCFSGVSSQSQVVIMFLTLGQRSNLGCRFCRILCMVFLAIFPALFVWLYLLEKKLRWSHCKPRIDRVSKTSHLFFVLLPHGPPLNFNPKVFRLTFQLATAAICRVVNSPSRLGLCGLRPWFAILGVDPNFLPLKVSIVFQIVWPPRPQAFFCCNCEIAWNFCMSYRNKWVSQSLKRSVANMVRIVNGQVVNSAVQKRLEGTNIESPVPRSHVPWYSAVSWNIEMYIYWWYFIDMGVSKNRGTPKWMVYNL